MPPDLDQTAQERKSRPAATVVLTRLSESSSCGFEILMLQRSKVGAFAGMWVFPGGRVDDNDPGEDDISRARSAAVREAAEEVSASIETSTLTVWSHWTPPMNAPVRFTTWFLWHLGWDPKFALTTLKLSTMHGWIHSKR